MANNTGAYGLRPIRMRDGTPWNGAVEKCYVHASYATALYVGMPVGQQTALAHVDPTGEHTSVMVAGNVASGLWFGVIVGIEPNPNNLSQNYIPASTGGYVYVATGKETVFIGRGNAAATPTKVFAGQNIAMVATAAGSTSTGLCGWHIAEDTNNTTQTLPLTILRVHQRADNTLGDNAEYEVIFNTGFPALAAGDALGVTAA